MPTPFATACPRSSAGAGRMPGSSAPSSRPPPRCAGRSLRSLSLVLTDPASVMSDASLSRRTFLKSAGLVTIGFSLLPGCGSGGAESAEDTSAQGASADLPPSLAQEPRIDAWLQILEDGRLRIYTGKI